MAKYRIKGPDGEYDIEAPDHASEADVLAFAQKQFGGRKSGQPSMEDIAMANPTKDMSTFDKAAAGVGKAIVDTGTGIKQLAAPVLDAIAPRRRLSDLVTGQDNSRVAELRREVADSRKVDEPLMDTGAGMAGDIAGNIGMMLLPGGALKAAGAAAKAGGAAQVGNALSKAGSVVLAPNTIAKAVPVGAAMGLVQSSASGEETLINTGVGAAASAAAPLIVKGAKMVKAAAEPFYEKGQQAILGRLFNRAAGDSAPAAQAALENAREFVPGSLPTAGQASGNAGIAALERTASAIEPAATQAYAERAAAQNAARTASLETVAGTPAARTSAEAARSAAANRLYEAAYESGMDLSRFETGKSPFAAAEVAKNAPNAATKEPAGILSAIKKLGGIKNADGTMLDVTGEARAGRGIKGIPPALFHKNGLGLDDLATQLRDKGYLIPEDAHDGGVQFLKDMIRDEVSGVTKHYSGSELDAAYAYMHRNKAQAAGAEIPKNLTRANDKITKLLERPALRDSIAQAKTLAANEGVNLTTPEGSVKGLDYVKRALDDQIGAAEGNQKRILASLKEKFLESLDELSPQYAKARTTFASMSKPINQMDVAAEIGNKSINKLTGNIQPAAYARALSDETAARATGFGNATLANTMAPEQLSKLTAIKDDLARSVFALNGGRGPGSDTVQKLAYSNFIDAAGVPTWLRNMAPAQVTGNIASRAADALYGRANKEMASKLATAGLNPAEVAAAMKLAAQPGNEKLIEMVSGGGSALGRTAALALINAQHQ